MKIEPQAREPDPFEKADSPSAVMAFVYAKLGKDGLKGLLSQIETDKEGLERDAAELQAIGLPEVSAVVMEAASTALPASILHCPYDESDAHNYESWQASYQRRHMLRRA